MKPEQRTELVRKIRSMVGLSPAAGLVRDGGERLATMASRPQRSSPDPYSDHGAVAFAAHNGAQHCFKRGLPTTVSERLRVETALPEVLEALKKSGLPDKEIYDIFPDAIGLTYGVAVMTVRRVERVDFVLIELAPDTRDPKHAVIGLPETPVRHRETIHGAATRRLTLSMHIQARVRPWVGFDTKGQSGLITTFASVADFEAMSQGKGHSDLDGLGLFWTPLQKLMDFLFVDDGHNDEYVDQLCRRANRAGQEFEMVEFAPHLITPIWSAFISMNSEKGRNSYGLFTHPR